MGKIVRLLGFMIFVLPSTAAYATEGRNDCISTSFQGPEFASIVYRNDCSETILAKVCSKYLISEFWNALNGRPGQWTCSGVNPVAARSTIDIRITAVEESSLARKALAETSYRIFTCEYPLKPVIRDTQSGQYDCILDPADRTPKWDEDEFSRLTATKLLSYDQETILGYAPQPIDCGPDVSHEIAGLFPDKPMTALDVMSEMRRVHLGISQSRKSSRCYLTGVNGPLVKFQFHGFIGQNKIFIIDYATRHTFTFPDHEGLKREIEAVLQRTGYLADECSAEFINETRGFFDGGDRYSVEEVIEKIRVSHKSQRIINRFRKCFAEYNYRFPATFQFQLIGGSPLELIFEMVYQTKRLDQLPDFEELGPVIRASLEEAGRLKQ